MDLHVCKPEVIPEQIMYLFELVWQTSRGTKPAPVHAHNAQQKLDRSLKIQLPCYELACMLNCTSSWQFSCNLPRSGLHSSSTNVAPLPCAGTALQPRRRWHGAAQEDEDGYLINFHPQLTSGTKEPRGQAQLLPFPREPLDPADSSQWEPLSGLLAKGGGNRRF